MTSGGSLKVIDSLPLTIGVVGHRKISNSNRTRIRMQIEEIIRNYQRLAPSTPIILLTALAIGADQIAAEVGLALEGVFVLGVLPMPLDKYEQDFVPGSELSAFQGLARSVDQVVEARLLYDFPVGGYEQKIERHLSFDSQEGRDIAYRDCGRFISQQSHVLIAVWDGEGSNLIAGTVDTISHRLNTSKKTSFQNDQIHLWPQETGTLLHILAPKEDDESETYQPDTQPPIAVLQANLESEIWDSETVDKTVKSFEWLNSVHKGRTEKSERSDYLSSKIMDTVDSEATRLQIRFRRLVSALLILGVLSLFLLDLQHDLHHAWSYLSALSFLAITSALWFQFVRGSLKDHFYQLRTLAEGLRVQTAWLKCGILQCPSNDYLQGIPDVTWVPRAMRSAWLVDNLRRLRKSEETSLAILGTEANDWLDGQIDYFDGKGSRKGAVAISKARYKRHERISLTGISIAFLCVFWDGLQYLSFGKSLPEWTFSNSQVLLHLTLSLSAASAAYSQLMAFREVERQYQISLQIFRRGKEILEHEVARNVTVREHITEVVFQVGREALQETGTWLALKRDRAVHPM